MRRITRCRYHRAVRHMMREDDRIRTTKLAEAISENRNRDLWSEVRRIKGRNKFLPSSIDGVVGDEEIAQLCPINIITSTIVCHMMLMR